MSRHPDAIVAKRWRWYASSLAVLISFAPFEIYAIFPLNDRIEEIGLRLRNTGEQDTDEKTQAELVLLLKKWQARNVARAMLVLTSALICLFDIIAQQTL